MTYRQSTLTPTILVLICFSVLLISGYGLYTIYSNLEKTTASASSTTKVTSTNLEDETDTTDDSGTDGTDGTNVTTTKTDDTTPPPIPPTPPPAEPDYRLSGAVTTKAEFLDSSGTPLSFVKTAGGKEITDFRISLSWSFLLGKDLDPNSVAVHVWSGMTLNYITISGNPIQGTIDQSRLFDATGFDKAGSTVYKWKMTDPHLGLQKIIDLGQKATLTASSQDFVVSWEATIKTKGGIVKKITGKNTILLFFMYEPPIGPGMPSEQPFYVPDYSDPMNPYPNAPWGQYDPTGNAYMSIIPIK